jgi:hypothetical protein
MPITCDQETKYLNQPKPPSEQLYVALPGHPLYGRLVSILRRRTTDTATHCLVEDPHHPTFCYQMLERWLGTEPPPPAVLPTAAPRALALSLVALDRLVQLLLAQQLPRMDEPHEGTTAHSTGSDLAPPPGTPKSETQ